MKVLGLDFGNVIKYKGRDELLPNFAESLAILKEKIFGDNVFIISRIDDEANAERVRHNAERMGVTSLIKSANIFFCLKRKEKAPIAKQLGITHFVDDRAEVLKYMDFVPNRFLLNWTKSPEFPVEGNIQVVSSWKDLVGKMI